MDKDKSAINEFLGEFGNNNTEVDPFVDNLKDPFNLEGEPQEVIPAKEEKPLPFNKDPKVSKFIEKEIEKRLKDFKVEPAATLAVDGDDYYERLIGNDTPEKVAMIREAKARDEQMLNQAEERAFNRLSQKEQEAIQADKEAEQELENAFDSIEEAYNVDITSNNPIAKRTRQEFVSFVEKIAPKDRNGDITEYPDMQNAWETFNEIKKATAQPNRAKEIASRSMARSNEAPAQNTGPKLTFDNVLEHIAL